MKPGDLVRTKFQGDIMANTRERDIHVHNTDNLIWPSGRVGIVIEVFEDELVRNVKVLIAGIGVAYVIGEHLRVVS